MTLLEPDRDQLEIFVEALFRHAAAAQGYVSIRSFYEGDSRRSFRISPTSLAGGLKFLIEVAEDDARRAANDPHPVVFCPPIAIFTNNKQAREQDIALGLALSVECDAHAQEALAKLEQTLGPATIVVRSGGEWMDATTGEGGDKLHVHYRLKQPARGKDQLDKLKLARGLATTLVGGDCSNKPVCHPIRWPGSWHRKAQPRLCEIESVLPDNEIDLDEALKKLNGGAAPQQPSEGGPQLSQGGPRELDWTDCFGKIITGEQFHPVLAPLASSFAARGIPEPAARSVLSALLTNTKTNDPERLKRRDTELAKLRDTVKSGFEKFASAVASPNSGLFDPWQEFIAPAFPLDILPSVARDFLAKQSIAIGIDPSAMAMATLASLSGAIHHRFRIKLTRNTDWWEHPRLWVLLIGRPAAKKTPGIDAATKPIEQYQAEVQREYRARLRADKDAECTDEAPEPPVRFVATDTTIEKLAELLSRSPRGILIKRDELAGWIGAMERYHASGKGASADRAFWLQSWNGGPYSVDRIKSGETFIENLSTSIIGAIQPARLAEIHGLTSDGLLQRFLPVLMQSPKLPTDIDCQAATKAYNTLVRELITLPAQQLWLTDAAVETLAKLRAHLFELEQVGQAISEGFEGFVGKLAGYAGRLALILHLADNPKEAVRNFIGQTVIENVNCLITDFLLPHAQQFYSVGEGESERLRKLASYILTCGKDRLRLADLTNNVTDCRGKTVLVINQQVSPLVAGGWLAPIEQGPTCRAWNVNRGTIDAQFAARAQTERDRKTAIAHLLGEQHRSQSTKSGNI